jgi:nucleotide-binding universal stress UspA family protein
MATFHHILAATDFSACAEPALELAMRMAQNEGAGLTLLHVWEMPSYAYPGLAYAPADLMTAVEDAAKKQLEETVARVRQRVPAAKALLCRGFPAEQIAHVLDGGRYDLVVMGTHGRRGVPHVLLGSVAERVVRTSSVPVLTVRPPQK